LSPLAATASSLKFYFIAYIDHVAGYWLSFTKLYLHVETGNQQPETGNL